ncbi:sphingoid long chain base kinase 4 [Aureobasidium pullulans]|uniref:Sphingoid long chain base kinase 4 n=1 Tax=Aureobasidium pullulans TaxID=5580 RepID=A0A4S8T120_AURPU|nr:sphingoid long chain base kinase 4 [Aureobasidium pullulans]
MSERSLPVDNPFVDPSIHETPSALQGEATLFVAEDASLTLGADSLIILDDRFVHREAANCCGLLPTRSKTTHSIPHYNILDASLDDLELTIQHALPTSKTSCRPSTISYTLIDKSSINAAKSWLAKLLDLAYGNSQRNKRIKVLVNPFGGQGAARKLYASEVEPLLRAAGCEIDAQETTHSGHAVEIARQLNVDAYDVVACASGDGLPHEVFNGLAQQQKPRRALRKVAVVQLPCGSGNAMSINLNGTNSPSFAALAIVKGLRTPLDLMAVTQGERMYWSFLSQAVGIIADCDLGTENMRWMGSARFTVGILTRLLGKTVYPAELAVKVDIDDKQAIKVAYSHVRSQREDVSGRREWEAHQDLDGDKHDSLPALQYGSVLQDVPSDWEKASLPTLGNFYCGNMAYMSPDTPFFAAALPSDNHIDMVNVDGAIPRLKALDMILAVEQNKMFDMDVVNYRKVSAYRISPKLRPGQKVGYISIDGEKVPFEPFQVEIVGGLGTVLSRNGAVYEFEGPK